LNKSKKPLARNELHVDFTFTTPMTNKLFLVPPILWRENIDSGYNRQTERCVTNNRSGEDNHQPETPERPSRNAVGLAQPNLSTSEKREFMSVFVPISASSPSQWLLRQLSNLSSPEVDKMFHMNFQPGDYYMDDHSNQIIPNEERVVEANILYQAHFDAAQDAVTRARNAFEDLQRCRQKAQKSSLLLKALRTTPTQKSLSHIYGYFYRKASKLASNGGSTYASLQQSSMEAVIDKMVELKCLPPQGVLVDLGAGLNLPALHMAQRMPSCCFVGIENNVERAWSFAVWYSKLMTKANVQLQNHKVAFICDDLFNYKDLDFCDVVYAYDEAFPPALMNHVIDMFVKSSRPQWLISFKPGRRGGKNLKTLMQKSGLEEIASVTTKKSGSGESSTAVFYRRATPTSGLKYTQHTVTKMLQPFWDENKKHVSKTVRNLSRDLLLRMPSKTRKSNEQKRGI
jgi:hypothetical protein